MAKSISILMSHEFTTGRGETETVAQALKWMEDHMSTEGEDGEESVSMSPGDLLVYAVRRLRALNKDNTRVAKGKAPARIYTPRVAQVKDATKNAAERKEEARQALAKALHVSLSVKAESKAPKGSPARGEQVKAKHEAKQARKAKADKGGASHSL